MEIEILITFALFVSSLCLLITVAIATTKNAHRMKKIDKAIENAAKTKVDWCHESLYCEDCKKKEDCRIWEAIQRGQ